MVSRAAGTRSVRDRVRQARTNGGETQNRTEDTGIFSPLLYRLSYLALFFTAFIVYRVKLAACQAGTGKSLPRADWRLS